MIKRVVNCLYAHKSNANELLQQINDNDFKEFCISTIKTNIKYEVIKVDLKKKRISLINSEDWYTANEPLVGDGVCIDYETRTTKQLKGRGQIYHHKWMFVADNYKGFDIEQAKQRSKEWEQIPNLKKNKIGYKKYWKQLLADNGMSL